MVRELMATFLSSQGNVDVLAASSLGEALEITDSQDPLDLILLDYQMPGMNGLDGLQQMIAASKGAPVALITGSISKSLAEAAIEAGAVGYVPKTLKPKALASAAQLMVAGEIYAPFNLMTQQDDAGSELLTDREMDVLRGICKGQSNKEIALNHSLHEATVKLHAKTLCRKLAAKNRTHAAMIARDLGLV